MKALRKAYLIMKNKRKDDNFISTQLKALACELFDAAGPNATALVNKVAVAKSPLEVWGRIVAIWDAYR